MRKRGFALLTPEQHRWQCHVGGKVVHERGKAHKFTREEILRGARRGAEVTNAKRVAKKEDGCAM
jgi:hypothetical protein